MTVDEFIGEYWGKPGGSEKSNFAPFVFDLCDLLGEKRRGQAEKGKLGEYEFEGWGPKGSFRSLDQSGAMDLYKRGHFNRLYEQPDQAVADAYGWGKKWAAAAWGRSEIVARLVVLNYERAAEEARGKILWLRPDYQIPRFGKKVSK